MGKPIRVFVVEDDPIYNRMIKYIAELDPDHEVHTFSTGQECLESLHHKPAIISLDFTLPDMDGGEVLKKIKEYDPNIEVIILSGQQDIPTAIKLLKEGAFDYITKDNETKDRLLHAIRHVKERQQLRQDVEHLRSQLNATFQYGKSIIGHSPAMQKVFRLMEKAAKSNITVSITGESGTGKEVAAKGIHHNSLCKNGPFIAVNMGAIPENLVESELFGYEKGAFTGALTRKKGQFELADKGTLFLDEIAEMDLSLQVKLLRAIETREFVRLGGETPIRFDARLIIATHKDLSEEVRNGNFREDLYYRLLGLNIHLPPLRERGEDIILLARFFLDNFLANHQMQELSLGREAKKKLLAHPYPGNVRELKAVIELATILCDTDTIGEEDIQFHSLKKELSFLTQEMSMEAYKKQIIHHYLKKYDDDVLLVAQKLNIGKSTIYRMLKELE